MPPLQTVVLRHDTPDGSFHFDWLFAVDEPPAMKLVCLRLESTPQGAEVGRRIRADRLADHRTLYLNYEGPISGNRGSVTRVATGRYEGDVEVGRVRVTWEQHDVQEWLIRDGDVERVR